MAAAPSLDASTDPVEIYRQLDAYPFDTDAEFQGGLRAILGSVNDPSQLEHLTLRAKCYYMARKVGTQIDFNGYKRWIETKNDPEGTIFTDGHVDGVASATAPIDIPSTTSATTTSLQNDELAASGGNGMSDAPRPASFAEICDMIAEGKPIPGIKDIPDTILEGQASDSNRAQRRKPWENATEGVRRPSWIT